MTLMNLRDAMLRRSAVRSTLLLLVIVVALLAGLLAMHTLSSGMGNHDGDASASMAMEMSHHGVDTGLPALPGNVVANWSGSSYPGQPMVTMACILALLVATLALFAPRSANRVRPFARPVRYNRGVTAANPLETASPPDLLVLSVSRT